MKPISDGAACVWITIHGILWSALIAGLALVVPKFEAMFLDFGIDLPAGTLAVVRMSHLVIRAQVVLLLIFIVGLWFDYVVLKQISWPGLWKWLMTVLPLLLLLIASLAIGQVWLTFRSSLSG